MLDNGSLTYVGEYRQKLFNVRVDHKLSPSQNLMFRFNVDHMFDTNPNDAVIGTTAPTAARRYTRRGWSTQVNHTSVLTAALLNEARFGYTNGDPVTLWEAVESGTIYQRTAGAVAVQDRRESVFESLQPPGAVLGHAVVVARQALRAAGRQHRAAHDRRHRQRAGTGAAAERSRSSGPAPRRRCRSTS